jgi:hypothetical protein
MDGPARRWAIVITLSGLLMAPTTASAVTPVKGARYTVHDHRTKGDAWHVELEVSKRDSARLRMVVLYDERCEETIASEGVQLTPEGVVDAGGAFVATDADGNEQPATWELDARFVTAHQVEGSFRIAEPGCETSRTFTARHGGHRHLTKLGYPNLNAAAPSARAEARRMLRRVRRIAASRFPTIERARRQGFDRYMVNYRPPPPGLFHLWSRTYNGDDSVLDPLRVESLVYWKPIEPTAEPVLLAFMFRARPGRPPRFAGNIPIWHNHQKGGDRMIHVWLTPDLRAAYANCLPVPELERSLHPFRFDDVKSQLHESTPCPQGQQ